MAEPQPEAAGEPAGHGDGRQQYYSKWDRLAAEEEAAAEAEAEVEKKQADSVLGLDSDAPISAAQKEDRAKREALKEAKKGWDKVESTKEAQQVVISDESGVARRSLSFEELGSKRVVCIRDCTDCVYELPSSLDQHCMIKCIVDSCERVTLIVHCSLITGTVEVSHCKDCVILVRHPTPTFQVDLNEGLTLWFGQNVLQPGHKIYSAACRRFRVDFDHIGDAAAAGLFPQLGESEASGNVLSTGPLDTFLLSAERVGLDAQSPQASEQQFVTTFEPGSGDRSVGGKDRLLTESIYRDRASHPTTKREIKERKGKVKASLVHQGIDPASEEGKDILKSFDPPKPDTVAEKHKAEGNKAFKERDYAQASVYYLQAIHALENQTGPDAELILCACYSNRAACQLKLGLHQQALQDADACLALQPENVKGLFRRGLALHAMGKYREACPSLGKALSLQPKNAQIKDALHFAERRAATQPPS
eukprot:SAG31_NODE_622_length_13493_cov_7.301254_3_plen_478_part_00